MYRKNVASQYLGFALITIATGAPDTGASVTVKIAIDNGAQATGGGTVTNLGGGQYRYNLAQADTNGNNISLLFSASGDFIVEKTIVTTAADPTDGVRFGLSALPNTAVTTNGSLLTSGAGPDQLTVSGGVASADMKKINAIATTPVTTVNAQQGTTQPINFTGTAGSALVKADAGTPAPTAAQVATAIWTDPLASADFATAASIGKLLKDDVDAAISSRMATYPQPAGFLAATFPAGPVASTTNLTAGTITTVSGNVNGSVASVTGAVGSVTGAVGSVTGNVGGNVVGAVGSLTPAAVDTILDRADAVEVGLTPRGALRLTAAASAGVLAGAATSTITIRNALANSKTRITATVDGSGNRSAVSTDVT